MKVGKTRLSLYRSLYWANQGLLQAVRCLEELRGDPASRLLPESDLLPSSEKFDDKLRRTQVMIEETRLLMNRNLAEWIEPNE